MNSLVILSDELRRGGGGGRVTIDNQERLKYIRELHELEVGRETKLGVFGGKIGRAVVTGITESEINLDVIELGDAPKRLPLTIICAIPRPQAVRRLLATACQLGIQRIVFCGSDRSDPSYLGTKELRCDVLQVTCIKALEQACDAVPVEVIKVRRLVDALNRELVGGGDPNTAGDLSGKERPGEVLLGGDSRGGDKIELNYHHKFYCDGPRDEDGCKSELSKWARLYSLREVVSDLVSMPPSMGGAILGAIGPEKGWSDRERRLLQEFRLQRLSLGDRMLQVDVAAQALAAGMAVAMSEAHYNI